MNYRRRVSGLSLFSKKDCRISMIETSRNAITFETRDHCNKFFYDVNQTDAMEKIIRYLIS